MDACRFSLTCNFMYINAINTFKNSIHSFRDKLVSKPVQLTEEQEIEEEIETVSFDKEAIISIRDKLISKLAQPATEEATKQWLIIPLLVALGYDPYSSDIIPEYTLDVGVKKGEKIDYVIQINNQPVALIECKQLNVSLSDKHVSQLYRYFTVSDVRIAILTNGDDYWFFTDSQKENVMDLKPYYKIKLSDASTDEIDKLEQYSKGLIQYVDIAQAVQYERFQGECKDLVHGLRTNTIPAWLLEILASRSGLIVIDKPTLADYLYTEIKNEFKIEDKVKKSASVKIKESKKDISNIKLNHEYIYNDYSDGDWKFHTLDYAIILGKKYEGISARSLLINTAIELFRQKKIYRKQILSEEQFSGTYKISETGGFRGAHYIEEYDIFISTSYGIDSIIRFISKLLTYAGIADSEIVVSFKS